MNLIAINLVSHWQALMGGVGGPIFHSIFVMDWGRWSWEMGLWLEKVENSRATRQAVQIAFNTGLPNTGLNHAKDFDLIQHSVRPTVSQRQ